jgi:hypothetical protein
MDPRLRAAETGRDDNRNRSQPPFQSSHHLFPLRADSLSLRYGRLAVVWGGGEAVSGVGVSTAKVAVQLPGSLHARERCKSVTSRTVFEHSSGNGSPYVGRVRDTNWILVVSTTRGHGPKRGLLSEVLVCRALPPCGNFL